MVSSRFDVLHTSSEAAGAAPDRPIHPTPPEAAYLKSLVLQVA